MNKAGRITKESVVQTTTSEILAQPEKYVISKDKWTDILSSMPPPDEENIGWDETLPDGIE